MDNFQKYIDNILDSNDGIIKLIISAVVCILLLLFHKQIAKGILNLLSAIFFKNKDKYKIPLKNSLQQPLSYYFVIIALFVLLYVNITIPIILKLFKIATILIICWGVVNYLSNNLFLLFHFGENADDKMNTTVIKFISNILKIVVISFAVVMVISEFGYNINGLLTGIGVGGLAISLAAKEAVENLISGFIIVFEKPFIVGDMIMTSSLQGVVEEVQMRSTKIRTIEDSVVTVPNSKLTSDAITNLSRMNKRLISLDFGLAYSTDNDTLMKCQKDIEKFVIDDEDILESPVRVNLTKLDDSSLNLSLTCYANTGDINEYLKIVSKVNYKVKEIIENNGTSFAFPSTSVYIENN